MKFPRGTYLGVVEDPLVDSASEEKAPFSGKIEVLTAGGTGLFLVKDGEVIAACYHEDGRELQGNEAFTYLKGGMEGMSLRPRFIQFRYGPEELALAEELCIERGLSLGKDRITKRIPQARLDDEALARFLGLQGVRAVLTFFEGFPVQTAGKGDFEQIAAVGEDFIRIAGKVAGDIDLGAPEMSFLRGAGGYVSSPSMETFRSVFFPTEKLIWE